MPRAPFTKYMVPLLQALKELGNSGQRQEVLSVISERLNLSDKILSEQLPSCGSRFANKVDWAKLYLMKSGYLESSERGVWRLTDKGVSAKLSETDIEQICREVDLDVTSKQKLSKSKTDLPEALQEKQIDPETETKLQLLARLRQLSPAAFEKVCQRFLREAGFQEVIVTGRSGDGGIDGKGILEVNSLMSLHVLFQCKRYKGPVGAQDIRNFRGAMSGRTDKGIFITTGNFTLEARREAVREGTDPIELVDADKLVTMFQKLKLGLKSKTVYELDEEFFDEFS